MQRWRTETFVPPPKKKVWNGECTIPMAKMCQKSKFLEETSFSLPCFAFMQRIYSRVVQLHLDCGVTLVQMEVELKHLNCRMRKCRKTNLIWLPVLLMVQTDLRYSRNHASCLSDCFCVIMAIWFTSVLFLFFRLHSEGQHGKVYSFDQWS